MDLTRLDKLVKDKTIKHCQIYVCDLDWKTEAGEGQRKQCVQLLFYVTYSSQDIHLVTLRDETLGLS